ncbi:MAG: hypothetical protein EPO65_06725 [Dehalococcoidia bacterium]|nr:MAG: hypothetical protein EPO65_06725 [Dehalococcoidia bacterium]
MLLTADALDALKSAQEHIEIAAEVLRRARAGAGESLAWVIDHHLEDAERRAHNLRALVDGIGDLGRLDAVAQALDAGAFREGEDAEGAPRIEVHS